MRPYSANKVISDLVRELRENYQDQDIEFYLDTEIAQRVNMSSSDLIESYKVYIISKHSRFIYELAKVQINLQKLREKIDARTKQI